MERSLTPYLHAQFQLQFCFVLSQFLALHLISTTYFTWLVSHCFASINSERKLCQNQEIQSFKLGRATRTLSGIVF